MRDQMLALLVEELSATYPMQSVEWADDNNVTLTRDHRVMAINVEPKYWAIAIMLDAVVAAGPDRSITLETGRYIQGHIFIPRGGAPYINADTAIVIRGTGVGSGGVNGPAMPISWTTLNAIQRAAQRYTSNVKAMEEVVAIAQEKVDAMRAAEQAQEENDADDSAGQPEA